MEENRGQMQLFCERALIEACHKVINNIPAKRNKCRPCNNYIVLVDSLDMWTKTTFLVQRFAALQHNPEITEECMGEMSMNLGDDSRLTVLTYDNLRDTHLIGIPDSNIARFEEGTRARYN